jgi:hypothetical protein
MSKREETLEELVKAMQEADLDQVYGIDTGIVKNETGNYRYATFCRARTLDGEVRVYSPKWILFRFMKGGRMERYVCNSKKLALKYIKEAL